MTRLGILGGGQLAQMLTQAAVSLGVETVIFERQADSPAARLTKHEIVGDWADAEKLREFISLCDVVTLENEFVDVAVLEQIAAADVRVFPTADTLRRVQDKLVQKQTLQAHGLPVPPFVAVNTPEDVLNFASAHGYPVVVKARRDGYDGYGNATIRHADDIPAAWEKLGGRALMVEAFVPFVRELAVMVVRAQDGEVRTYPVVETVQQDHICHVVRAPATISAESRAQAKHIAAEAVNTIDGVGVFGVELFQLADDSIIYNEIAPRPHNSGHYTIEACITSQFENHIRAVLGWPLGQTVMIAPCAVMVNTLGRTEGDTPPDAARGALWVAGAHVHVYGKRQTRTGRKMGHITVLGADLDDAEAAARQAAELIGF